MKKGIFCLEGHWDGKLSSKSSVQPILELLEKQEKIPHIYSKCATETELEFYLKKWGTKTMQKKFPILYLAFHGDEQSIKLTNNKFYDLDLVGKKLQNKCNQSVIFFASCKTLDIHGNLINSFLNKTNALAVLGYRGEVDWMVATAFELLVLNALQEDLFDTRGIRKISEKIMNDYGKLHKILDFSLVMNKNIYIRRKRE